MASLDNNLSNEDLWVMSNSDSRQTRDDARRVLQERGGDVWGREQNLRLYQQANSDNRAERDEARRQLQAFKDAYEKPKTQEATVGQILSTDPASMTQSQLGTATKAAQDLLRTKQLIGTSRSYGNDAADTLQKSQDASSNIARQTAEQAGGLATSGAIRGARTAGLSKAQAAQVGAGQTGNTIMGSYLTDLNQNKANYLRAAEGFQQGALGLGSLANQEKGLDIQKYGIDTQAATAKAQLGQQAQQYEDQKGWNVFNAIVGGVSGLAGGAGALVKGISSLPESDERVKHDLSSGYGMLESVVSKVKPYKFKYDQEHEPGKPETERLGVMAQELEQTPLAYTVQKDQEGVRRVDTPQLTLANTAMIADLSKKLDMALSYIKNRG